MTILKFTSPCIFKRRHVEIKTYSDNEFEDTDDEYKEVVYRMTKLQKGDLQEVNEIVKDPLGFENLDEYICAIDNMVIQSFSIRIVYKGCKQYDAISTIECSREPTPEEIDDIADGIHGQFTDGYGEGLEQDDIIDNVHLMLYVPGKSWEVKYDPTIGA